MIRGFYRLLVLACLCCCLAVAALSVITHAAPDRFSPGYLLKLVLLAAGSFVITAVIAPILKDIGSVLDTAGWDQAQFLDCLDAKYIDLAIVGSAALSLFLELAVIRWQASALEFFAFYKNLGLLACFAGLGVGYALAQRDRIPVVLVLPLLAWQFGLLVFVRFGMAAGESLRILPIREQLGVGVSVANFPQAAALYSLLTFIFLVTALTFLPIGQLCGRLMERRNNLKAYGLNLLGSLLGVVLMIAASFLWTPPAIWFLPCFVAILLFQARKPSYLIAGIVFTALCTSILVWPVHPLWNRIYSPYQLLEVSSHEETGLPLISAAGHFYQKIYDFSSEHLKPSLVPLRDYYDFPYKAYPHARDIAVVGAGTGNDVAAALRSGAASVHAIEIDPAILLIGKKSHPEKPYADPRVDAVVNDARSFLRTDTHQYDLIVYGLLDSHTLLSHGSSVRLDSFVYTVEGLREARNRLKPDGMISLSFAVLSMEMGRKIFLMMQQAFDGRPPICVMAKYDESVIFLESNDTNWVLPPNLLNELKFSDWTAAFANPSLHADVSTDDWPFFYMPRRVYPVSYLVLVFQVLVLSLLIMGSFLAERPKFSHLSFFFLGAGFMLVETKGITEMGLTFGNTWQVIGFVMAGVLIMAWLGNFAVQLFGIRRPWIPYLLLWSAVALGWFVAKSGGLSSTTAGRLETAIILTCPMLFSGIVFSTLLSSKGAISGIMAMNLLGAICGGLLEYNSMYFGFRSLYLVAMGCYVLAFVFDVFLLKKGTEPEPVTLSSDRGVS
jgi:hypothetical protein